MAEPQSQDELPASGELGTHRPEVVLQFCERVCFTGTLTFSAADIRGVLPMLNGTPEIEEDPRIEWALEQFLGLADGRYVLTQMLPPLQGAKAEGLLTVVGKLDPATVADLMRYCEGAGLSGQMTIRDESDHHCMARYERGDLVSLDVDEQAGADYTELFSWSRGTFLIRADSVFKAERAAAPPSPPRPSTGFLRTLEVALTEIMSASADRSQKLRPVGAMLSLAPPSMLRGSTLPFGAEGARADAGGSARVAGEKPPVMVAPKLPEGLGPLPSSGLTGRYKARRSVAPGAHNPEATVKIQFVVRDAEGVTPGGMVHSTAKGGSEEIPLDGFTQRLPASSTTKNGDVPVSAISSALASAVASAPPLAIGTAPPSAASAVVEAQSPPGGGADSAGYRRALDADAAGEQIRRGSNRPPDGRASAASGGTAETDVRRARTNVALSIAFALVAAVTAVAALAMLARLMG